MKRLPLNTSDFTLMRESSLLYVDKTAIIHKLISSDDGAYMLSRPPRFGKSVLCSTLKAIFEAKREYFDVMGGYPALDINSLNWEWKKYPVIYLDMSDVGICKDVETLRSSILSLLIENARKNGMEIEGNYPFLCLKNLISSLKNEYDENVVVIIDDYDKPLLDSFNNPTLYKEMLNEMLSIYGVLKSTLSDLRFVFYAGVTKYAIDGIFSYMNYINDLNLNDQYAEICGFTEKEFEDNFESEINEILLRTQKTKEEYFDELKSYYFGHRFCKEAKYLYIPFGLMHHFYHNGELISFWMDTALTKQAIKIIVEEKVNVVNYANIETVYEFLRAIEPERFYPLTLLYQSGLLTIKNYDAQKDLYTLDFPNIEVKAVFAKAMLKQYLNSESDKDSTLIGKFPLTLNRGNAEEAINTLTEIITSVKSEILQKDDSFFEVMLYLVFSVLGFKNHYEINVAGKGHMEIVVKTKNYYYYFEFISTKSKGKKKIGFLRPNDINFYEVFQIKIEINDKNREMKLLELKTDS